MKCLLMSVVCGLFLSGCATPRTKNTDPAMRVFLSCENLDSKNCLRLKQSLVSSGKWIVVDRDDGLKAAVKEQDFNFKDQDNRVTDRERYAVYGEMFGAGGVFIAGVQCAPSKRFWAYKGDHDCVQNLSIVDTKTGVVITSVEDIATDAQHFYGEIKVAPSWGSIVEKLDNAFPSHYVEQSRHAKIIQRENEAETRSVEMRKPSSVPTIEGGE
ncbi:MAG: hypothetical protein HUU57_12925 [Bdellovibrio sp.]|nr:hypothetical protein [Bdellovibrio sp.]